MFSNRGLSQISIGLSREMLVSNESTFKLHIKSCSQISLAKLNESLIVYLFLVYGINIGTKHLARLCLGACKANKIGLNGGKLSTLCLCTLQNPHIDHGQVPTCFTGFHSRW